MVSSWIRIRLISMGTSSTREIPSSGHTQGSASKASMEDEEVVVGGLSKESHAAAAAGIHPGEVKIADDRGIAVNTAHLGGPTGECAARKGPHGQEGYLREGSAEPLQLTLKRARVRTTSVRTSCSNRLGLVRSPISEQRATIRRRTQKDLRKRMARRSGMVIDLRTIRAAC